MKYEILSDTQIRHRSETRGVVITRTQRIAVDGKRYVGNFWTNFETGILSHIESIPEAN